MRGESGVSQGVFQARQLFSIPTLTYHSFIIVKPRVWGGGGNLVPFATPFCQLRPPSPSPLIKKPQTHKPNRPQIPKPMNLINPINPINP